MKNIERHSHFDLWTHKTHALEIILGQTIINRETIHDWPLSSVQLITLKTNKKLIYKTQSLATIEPKFYKNAKSPLLPDFKYLDKIENCDIMVFEYLDGVRVSDKNLSEEEVISLGKQIQKEISEIEGELPVYTDIRNVEYWKQFVQVTLQLLSNLITNDVFTQISISEIEFLNAWANQPNILECIEGTSCFTHGDPNGDNIFITPNGLKVIDWQRPRFAPQDIDLAALLNGKGFNMYKYVSIEVAQILWFLRINWFTVCKTDLFRNGKSYEKQISKALVSLKENNSNVKA
jgi:thiamine kinase-like enzyme